VPLDAKGPVRTLIGTAHMPVARLFTFGDQDGKGREVRLQHPLDVHFHDGLIYVADTYNHKIKVIHPKDLTCTTIAGGNDEFNEPAGLTAIGKTLYVADTNHHRIQTIDLADGNKVAPLEIKGLEPPQSETAASNKPDLASAVQVKAKKMNVKPADGSIRLEVALELAEGLKINETAPMHYYVEADGNGIVDRSKIGTVETVEKPSSTFDLTLPVTKNAGADSLRVFVSAYYCQEGAEGVCRATSVVWNVPLNVDAKATVDAIKLSHKIDQ
jgi:hypothetical protein